MFNTLFQGAIPMRIGVVALPTTRAISYHEDRSNSRNRFFWIVWIFLIFLVFLVFMAVPPPLEKNHSLARVVADNRNH